MGSKAYSSTTSQDNRVQLDSTGGGKFVAPAAVSSDPGSLALGVGDFSSVNLAGAAFKMGMSGTEVAGLIAQQASIASQNLASVADYGKSAIAAVQANKSTEIAAAGGQGWQQYVPLIVAGIVAVAVFGKSRRKAA
jgi:hypothetical protein